MTTEDNKQAKSMRLISSVTADYLAMLDERCNGVKHHIPSGFTSLDSKFPGWLHAGHLIVIAGRPGMGKTVLGQQVAENVAAEGKTSIFFSLEMSSYEVVERSISRRTGIPIPVLKTGMGMTVQYWNAVSSSLPKIATLPLLIEDNSFEIASIVNKAKSAAAALESKKLQPLGCIVIDYIQLVVSKGANRVSEVGQVTGALKRLAKELQVPVIALCQLNRGVEGRVNKRPGLSDLRESGNIEQDADAIFVIYRDEYYNEASNEKGIAEVNAGKNRHGATGMVRMAFVGERVMFGDLSHE